MREPVDTFDTDKHDTEAASMVPRGPGDPDAYGYPGEDNNDKGADADGTRTDTAIPF
jgi:hypothetical protein